MSGNLNRLRERRERREPGSSPSSLLGTAIGPTTLRAALINDKGRWRQQLTGSQGRSLRRPLTGRGPGSPPSPPAPAPTPPPLRLRGHRSN
jgi:hypothetical protein